MDLIIENINSKQDTKVLKAIAKRLGYKASVTNKEESNFANAIRTARNSGYISEVQVMKTLNRVKTQS